MHQVLTRKEVVLSPDRTREVAEAVSRGAIPVEVLETQKLDRVVTAEHLLHTMRRMRMLAVSAGLDGVSHLMEKAFYASYDVVMAEKKHVEDF